MNQLHWVPFKISEKEALRIFERFHCGTSSTISRWLLPNRRKFEVQSIKKTLLPFYSVSATVDSHLSFSKKLMTSRTTPDPDDDDSITRHLLRNRWNGMKTEGLQIYASNYLDRYLINRIKGDPFLVMEKMPADITANQSISVLAFSMDPSTALHRYVAPFIKINEQLRAEQFLKHRYKQLVQREYAMHLNWHDVDVTPCYLPCYIVESMFDDDLPMTTYIDGVLGRASGHAIKDPVRAGALSSLVGTGLGSLVSPGMLSGGLTLKEMALWLSVFSLSPYLLGHMMTENSHIVAKVYDEHKQNLIQGFDSTAVEKFTLRDNPVWWNLKKLEETFSQWQEQQTHEFESENWSHYYNTRDTKGKSSEEIKPPRHPDPMGFYQLLGFQGKEASISVVDVQNAFKRLASRYHPDRHSTDAKEEAAAIFQQISLAYSVLKDGISIHLS